MDRLDRYREIIETVLRAYAAHPPSHGQIETELVIDPARREYLLLDLGWDTDGRVHSVFGHVRLKDGKIWIEEDGTENGVCRGVRRGRDPERGYRPRLLPPRAAEVDGIRGRLIRTPRSS